MQTTAQVLGHRFNKANVEGSLRAECCELEENYGFEWGHGRATVEGCTADKKIALGRYEALRDIIEQWF
jgi:hypothetical protein